MRDAPHRNCRRFPEKLSREEPRSRTSFACLTTAECYAAFPLQVHASMPLNVSELDHEPAGLTARAHDTEAPATGRRRCDRACLPAAAKS